MDELFECCKATMRRQVTFSKPPVNPENHLINLQRRKA